MRTLYRGASGEYDDCYLIGFDYDIIPMAFRNINEWLAALYLFPDYITEIPLTDNNDTVFDESMYKYIKIFLGISSENKIYPSIDYMLLKHKLGMRVPQDNTALIRKYCEANVPMVEQYLKGKTVAINQLMGTILKENKGMDPKQLRSDIEEFINTQWKQNV